MTNFEESKLAKQYFGFVDNTGEKTELRANQINNKLIIVSIGGRRVVKLEQPIN